jgi:hypothetical protein
MRKASALTCGQLLYLFFDALQTWRAVLSLRRSAGLAVSLAWFPAGRSRLRRRAARSRHVGEQGIARLLAAEPVQRAVGQDALEQHGQLFRRLVPIVLGQLDHAVLHDVQGGLRRARGNRALEGALFHVFEESDSSCSVAKAGAARRRGAVRQVAKARLSHSFEFSA